MSGPGPGLARPGSPPSAPWADSGADVAAALDTDPGAGLTVAEAARRLATYGPNELASTPPSPLWRKLAAQFADPLVYLLLVAVVVSAVVWLLEGSTGFPFDVVVIVAIVMANAVLGYIQVERAEQAVAALQRMTAATVTVVREGDERRIPTRELVPGDLVNMAEGDAVGADARLVEAAALTVAEAALTGESEPVLKHSDPLHGSAGIGDRFNMVFAGTAVTRGRGRAVVTATAMDTEMGTVARLLDATETRRTPLQREIDLIGRMLGVAIVVIAVVVMAAIVATSSVQGVAGLVAVLLVGVSLAVAAVPEGLPAILSVVLSIGVQRLARRQAVVKRLSSVETLGSATVICSDKTGTLTRNEMTVVSVVTPSGRVDLTGSGYEPTGQAELAGEPLTDTALADELALALGGGSLANDARLAVDGGGWSIQGDPTEAAFLVAAAKVIPNPDEPPGRPLATRYPRFDEIPFTSERRQMTTLHRDTERPGEMMIVSKGSPDVILDHCTDELVAGQSRPLSSERRLQIAAAVDQLAGDALRTLAIAYRRCTAPSSMEDRHGIEDDLVYLGVVGIIDPPRSEARAAVAEAHRAGIRTVMITGDHPRTALAIAASLGLIDDGATGTTDTGTTDTGTTDTGTTDTRVLSGAELAAMTKAELQAAVQAVSVFARVAPEHKLRIVEALQAGGEVVAMTGDGVNDAPALKAADIGVAMGITGTEVAKEAADMILADDNFATIVTAVRQGRAILSNIRKFLRFLLSSNMGEVLTMFVGVLAAGPLGLDDGTGSIAVPLLATQILWVNLLSDTAPALAMGVDPAPDDIMTRPPRRPDDRVIDTTMWIGIVWIGLVTAVVSLAALDLGQAGGWLGGSGDLTRGRTMAFSTLVLAQLFNTVNARSDRVSAFHHLFTNRLLWAAVALAAGLQVAVVHIPVMNTAFDTTPLSIGQWALCVGLASIVLWAAEARKLIARITVTPRA